MGFWTCRFLLSQSDRSGCCCSYLQVWPVTRSSKHADAHTTLPLHSSVQPQEHCLMGTHKNMNSTYISTDSTGLSSVFQDGALLMSLTHTHSEIHPVASPGHFVQGWPPDPSCYSCWSPNEQAPVAHSPFCSCCHPGLLSYLPPGLAWSLLVTACIHCPQTHWTAHSHSKQSGIKLTEETGQQSSAGLAI